MFKIAIVVLADIESHADLGRIANALETAKEFQESGDLASIIFDGAGTRWIGVLANPSNRSHALFESVRGSIAGACSYCASAFKVRDQIEAAGIPLLSEFDHHPSLRKLIADGYQIITF